jgi:hypothetical protein
MTESGRDPLPFDRVVLRGRTYSAEEFLRLSLNQRVRHILKRDVEFFHGDAKVDATTALAGLRKATTGKDGA